MSGRVHYSEIVDRFHHVDAGFVESRMEYPEGPAYFRVSLYPWWEHPNVIRAHQENKRWKFVAPPEETHKVVTVYPVDLCVVKLSQVQYVIDWEFTTDHPLLWETGRRYQIFINSHMTQKACLDLWQRVLDQLDVERSYLATYILGTLDQVRQFGLNPPFALGSFPAAVYQALREALGEMDLRYLANDEPAEHDSSVLFLIDGSINYIIARDFEVEVPDFEHKPEWCIISEGVHEHP